MDSITKHVVLVCSTPVYGRLISMRVIAKDLITCGDKLYIVMGSANHEIVEDIGASFVPLLGSVDFTEGQFDIRWPERKTKGLGTRTVDLRHGTHLYQYNPISA